MHHPTIKETTYDLAIIGGGINGVSIARDAAMRGMRVILFEKEDFGSGASTKTSKLVHGGLRYLENLQLHLVKESIEERALLLKNAPHLVTPLGFILPVYQHDPYPLWMVKFGLYIYDHFDRKGELPKYQKLSKEEILSYFPNLRREGLKGGCLYYDTLMKDNRLIFENLRASQELGATLLNYTTVTGFTKENAHLTGVEYVSSHIMGRVKAKAIVNTTGAWSNDIVEMNGQHSLYVTPTKGVHLVLSQISPQFALLLRSQIDQRIFFLIPWENKSLLGTTDTFYEGSPNQVRVEVEDKNYLLKSLAYYFPDQQPQVISSFAGLRPLVRSNHKKPSYINRGHEIHCSSSGLISISGGKFTTHRKVAEEAVDQVAQTLTQKYPPCRTAQTPFFDSVPTSSFYSLDLTEDQINHLFSHYGQATYKIVELINSHPEEISQICPLHPHLMAEVRYAIEFEGAKKLEDWFLRRTYIGYSECKGITCLEQVSHQFAQLLGWDESTRQAAAKEYLIT